MYVPSFPFTRLDSIKPLTTNAQQSIAIAWAKARASGIVLVGRSKETLDLTAKNVTDTSTATRVVEVVADTTSEQDVENLFVEIQTSFGIAHVLINTAGTVNGGAEIGKISPSQWWRDFESNFKGFYFISHFFINKFQGEGTIINLSTVGASMLNPGMSSYTIAKLAAIKLAEYIDTGTFQFAKSLRFLPRKMANKTAS